MPIPLFNRFGGNINNSRNQQNNISHQLAQVSKNPGAILDILLQNGKINQQQYAELQQYKTDPRAIAIYLIQHGNANQISQAENIAGEFRK